MEKIIKISELILSEHQNDIPFSNLKSPLILNNEKEAYEVQFLYHKNSKRGIIGGYKIALASKIQQKLCGIQNPIAGGIFKNEIYKSSRAIHLNNYQSLGLEFEIAFETSQDIYPHTLKEENFRINNYIKNAYSCFELIDDRNASYDNLDALTLIADNAWSAGVILGNPIKNWKNLDFNNLNSKLFWNSELIGEAKLSSTNPLNSLNWVLHHLNKLSQKIEQGSIIITGSLLQTKKPKSGDLIKFEIENLSSVTTEIH